MVSVRRAVAAWAMLLACALAAPAAAQVAQRPTRILLAVNMKTAAALGVTIPQVVLLRADQVIE